jgi:hypothetical protein
MKLTNKILLIVLVLVLIIFTAFKIKLNNSVELVPVPYKHGAKDTTFTFGSISAFDIKGYYSVEFIKSDYDTIKINGPDNLIDNYTKIVKRGEILSVEEMTDLSKYQFELKIRIYTKAVESIYARKGAIVLIYDFAGINFDVTAEDSSIVNAEDSSFSNVNISTKNKAVVSIENVGSANVKMYNSSSIFLGINNGEISGTRDNNTELILLGDVKTNKVMVIGKEISKGRAEYE